ncbi:hypothetical protein LCI18_003024 [Fusarium solani-melongenae]|uniref:Uncharacterized protein n=1 Tax=Fusarium solani subsp. cucurbitae TaxID=2747967 RepID=A0ACD3YSX4_FUSSC|nr:hypothetical protein LCI18_003024 [Fusarium solani-melongenae]
MSDDAQRPAAMVRKEDLTAPQDWRQRPPNDNFSYFTDGKTNTVILQSEQPFHLRSSDKFDTTKLHIYAETIHLDGDITLPGKELGLFCNRLVLPGDADKKRCLIDVTGKRGDDCTPNQPVTNSNNGQNGGSIVIYIEEFDDALIPGNKNTTGLFLQACGGDGGRGATNTSSSEGGRGGDGGDGGSITVYFGHALFSVIHDVQSLLDEPDMSWMAKLKKLQTYDFKVQLSEKNKNKLSRPIAEFLDVANKIVSIQQLLELEQDEIEGATEEVQNLAGRLSTVIRQFQRAPTEANFDAAISKTTTELLDKMDKMRQVVGSVPNELWEGFLTCATNFDASMTKALEAPKEVAESTVRGAVDNVIKELKVQMLDNGPKVMRFNYSCEKGSGGQGGRAPTIGQPNGANGDPGRADGPKSFVPVDFIGSPQSLRVADPIAHPDQCQMLLNRADVKYYAASGGETVQNITQEEMRKREAGIARALTGETDPTDEEKTPRPEYEEARVLYQKILRRLHFVPALKEQLDIRDNQDLLKLPKEEQERFSLAASYAAMVSDNLCLDPIAQLFQVYDHAVQRLNWTSIGMDFMGHAGLWTPRLTYKFYETELDGFVSKVTEVAKSLADIQGEEKAKAALEKSHQNCKLQLEGIQTRIMLLTAHPNGELRLIGTQIAEYTPLLKAKRTLLQKMVAEAKVEIKKEWNWDPKILLDALCMIAFCPSKFNVGAQLANGVYKSATTVQSLDGEAVDKTYVVSQFGDAGESLEALADGYKSRPDGSLSVDDPGATKLLSTKTNLEKLLKNFQNTIPTLHTKIEKQLNEYVSIIEKRNKAVMDYNASLQLLAKAYADRDFYESRDKELGQVELSTYDPMAPSIRLWLTKYRQDLRYNILSTLYRGERALQFWGLADDLPDIPAAEDLSDLDLLRRRTEILKQRFQDALTARANNPGTVWPAVDGGFNNRGRGKFFQLSPDDVAAFKKATSISVNGADPLVSYNVHEAYFTIPPARAGDSKAQSDFAGHADVRIDSVKAWLYGAKVSRRNNKAELAVTLVHLGEESIVREDNKVFEFKHDAVTLTCTYDPTEVQSAEDIPKSIAYDNQNLNSFHSAVLQARAETGGQLAASFGPFAQWRLSVSSQHNLGLDMTGLTDIAIEFTGESRRLNL